MNLKTLLEPDEAMIPLLLQSSFKNFHTKGFEYLCLFRSPEYTIKMYIFDGDVAKLPEVVNPHDHRYKFNTMVLHGEMIDYRFQRSAIAGDVYQAFDYLTPLNGGNGFTFRGEERLMKTEAVRLFAEDTLLTNQHDLHTIQMVGTQNVLILEQFGDEIPIDRPTSTWVRLGEPKPDLSGLYEKFALGEFMDRLKWVKENLI